MFDEVSESFEHMSEYVTDVPLIDTSTCWENTTSSVTFLSL